MVLLIASANTASLLLARASARKREMTVRMALGAGRARLMRQTMAESLLLSSVGGALGLFVATGPVSLSAATPVLIDLPGLNLRMDNRVLGFGALLSVVTGLLCGVVPAVRASPEGAARSGLERVRLRHGRYPSVSLRNALVVVQLALSVTLVAGAVLTLRTLMNLRSVPLGFEPERLLHMSVEVTPIGVSTPVARLDDVRRTVLEVSGVQGATFALIAPFSENRMANDVFWDVPGGSGGRSRTNVDMNLVGVDYFSVMGIDIVRGRALSDDDRSGVDVAVVNGALARRFWPGLDPIGRSIWTWKPRGLQATCRRAPPFGLRRWRRCGAKDESGASRRAGLALLAT